MYPKIINIILTIFIMVLIGSCNSVKKINRPPDAPVVVTAPVPIDSTKNDEFLVDLLKAHPLFFDSILKNSKSWNVQVIYTQIDRGANGIPALKTYYYNVNSARYFYPASTIKFPASLLALQKLNELNRPGLTKYTPMITEQGYKGGRAVYNDPTSAGGKPSVAHYIKKILMVSDNDANNRLYEFLGQQYINDELHKKGYEDVQILHRLDIALPTDENRYTNPVKFLGSSNEIVYEQPLVYNTTSYITRNDSLGKGFYRRDSLVNEPMDFSYKNRISLEDLHTILISFVFPAKVRAHQRFTLTAEDRKFIFKYMSQLPTESTFPPYSSDTAAYWPAYCKFLLFGAEKGELPKNIRIFNKVGDAYGQLTDVAYIVDLDKKIEFFLSATIYCNNDGILNDDKYNYEDIGLPFMKHLGEVLYEHELKRTKKVVPDLSDFVFKYDK